MIVNPKNVFAAIAITALMMTGCSQMDMGSSDAKTVGTGSAAGETSVDANSALERCEAPLGTVALVENRRGNWWHQFHQQYKLNSTIPVLKLLVQQSNCFVVVDRGRAKDFAMDERDLRDSGEMRSNSNFGKGQIAAADYSISPSITFNNNNAGGIGAALGGLVGSIGSAVGGAMNFKTASTVLTLVDNRSTVQIAAAEGSAKNMDVGGFALMGGSNAAGGLGAYTNTAEGKVLVAAFMDSYNNMVRALRNYKTQTVKGGLGTGGQLKVQGGQ